MRGLWIAAIAAGSVLAPCIARAAQITVDEREPLALLLIAPGDEIANSGRSEIYRIVSDILRDKTSFRLTELENPTAADKCLGSVGCLVLEARPDFDPEHPDTPRANPKNTNRAPARWLVVLSVKTPVKGEDRVNALLIDTDQSINLYRAEKEEFDDAIFKNAVHAQPAPIVWDDPGDVEPSLRKLLLDTFPPSFAREHDINSFASIVVSGPLEGVQIELDGAPIGSTSAGETVIKGLGEGKRRLVFTHPSYISVTREVDLSRGGSETIELSLVAKSVEANRSVRTALFWSGVGAAAVGTTISVIALLKASGSDAATVCLTSAGSSACPDTSSYVRLSEPDSGNPAERGGILMGPLGYSLGAAGVAWALGSLIDEEAAPWLALGAGIALGFGAYALSAIAEPANPYDSRAP